MVMVARPSRGCGEGSTRRRVAACAGTVLLFLLLPSACSLVLTASGAQCRVDSDCERRGGAFTDSVCAAGFCRPRTAPVPDAGTVLDGGTDAALGGPWACLGGVRDSGAGEGFTAELILSDSTDTEGPALTDPQPPFAYHARVGASVKMCATVDIFCANPLASQVTDARGIARFRVGANTRAFLDVTRQDIVPLRVYLNPGVRKDGVVRFLAGSLGPDATEALAAAVGAYDPQAFRPNAIYSHIIATATDCEGLLSGGTVFSISRPGSKVVTFFVVSNAPSVTATETDYVSGIQGFVNLPVGQVTVTGRVAGTGQMIGALNVYAPAGTFVVAPIVPTVF